MFSPDFREFVQLLNKNNVQYMIVGGYAVAYMEIPATLVLLTSGYCLKKTMRIKFLVPSKNSDSDRFKYQKMTCAKKEWLSSWVIHL